MRIKYGLALAALAFVASIFLTACGNPEIRSAKTLYRKAMPLGKAVELKGVTPETVRLLGIASSVASYAERMYGLTESSGLIRYLPGSLEHLAWRAVTARKDSVTAKETKYFHEKRAAERYAEKSADAGLISQVEPHDSLRWATSKPAPLLDAFASWPYENIVEWVFLQVFETACDTSKKKDELSGLPIFLAEKATIEYLAKNLSPASPVVARYTSGRRDERTFLILFEDYLSRFKDLYAQDPLPEDTPKRRELLSAMWIAEYKSSYTNRFITNTYAGFGNPPPGNIQMAAHENRYSGWRRREKDFAMSKMDIASFIGSFNLR